MTTYDRKGWDVSTESILQILREEHLGFFGNIVDTTGRVQSKHVHLKKQAPFEEIPNLETNHHFLGFV